METSAQNPIVREEASPVRPESPPTKAESGSPAAPSDGAAHRDQQATLTTNPGLSTPPEPSTALPRYSWRKWSLPRYSRRKWLLLGAIVVALGVTAYFVIPAAGTALNTVSTDDAYVNGHMTFVAPRVMGQVSRVLVDDNLRVKEGELLVELDEKPYQVQVAIKEAALASADADLAAAQAQVRALVGQVRSNRS